MKKNLTAEQVKLYQEQGFVVIENLLSSEELKKWIDTINIAIKARNYTVLPFGRKRGTQYLPGVKCKKATIRQTLHKIKNKIYRKEKEIEKKLAAKQYRVNILVEYNNLWEDSLEYRQLIFDETFGKMATKLEGIPSVRIWSDRLLSKCAWADPSAWHSDVTYSPYDSKHSLTFWIALQDTTLKNGCMYYLPGTHKLIQGFDAAPVGRQLGALFKTRPEFKDMEPVAVELKAGSCVVHNGLTIHSACANMSPHERKAVAITFFPSNATYNGKRSYFFPDKYFDDLQIGSTFDDKYNPIVYDAN